LILLLTICNLIEQGFQYSIISKFSLIKIIYQNHKAQVVTALCYPYSY